MPELQRVEIRLSNSSARPIALVLEPWGEIVELEPGATYEASSEGPPGDTIEIDIEDGLLKLWAPNDSSLDIRNANDGTSPKALDAVALNDVLLGRSKEAPLAAELHDRRAQYGGSEPEDA